MRGLGRRCHAVGREPEVVDLGARPVLDRATGKPRRAEQPHRLRDISGRVGVTVLAVGGDGNVDRGRQRATVRDRLVPRDVAIRSAERRCEPAARRRDRAEPECFQDLCRACVERVRLQERRTRNVQSEKVGGLAAEERHPADSVKPNG